MPRPTIGDKPMTATERSLRRNQATKDRIAQLEAEVARLDGILNALVAKAKAGAVDADDVMAAARLWRMDGNLPSRKSP